MHLSVNRYLADPAMDKIDHALGRPVDPLGETYRDHYAADGDIADALASSPHWTEGKRSSTLRLFSVTQEGRQALADHLREIGDPHRAFIVSWGGMDMPVAAKNHAAARYSKWLDVSDTRDVSFKDFMGAARVRLA